MSVESITDNHPELPKGGIFKLTTVQPKHSGLIKLVSGNHNYVVNKNDFKTAEQ